MKSKKSNNKLLFVGLIMATFLLSSCNRGGYGCPVSYEIKPILDLFGL